MPFQSLEENSAVAVTDLINALQHPAPAAPYAHIGDQQMESLQQMVNFFQRTTIQSLPNQPQPPHPLPASTPQPKTVRFHQHPGVVVPRVETVPTVAPIPRVPQDNSTIPFFAWAKTCTHSRSTATSRPSQHAQVPFLPTPPSAANAHPRQILQCSHFLWPFPSQCLH